MEVTFDQDGLEGEKQGYARLQLVLDPGEGAFAAGDSIAIGRYQGSSLEFLLPDGSGWGGDARPLHLSTEPEVNGAGAVFLLQPAYVNEIDEGPYEIRLLGAGGEEKATGQAFIDYIVHSPLAPKLIILEQQKEKAQEPKKDLKAVLDTGEHKADAEGASPASVSGLLSGMAAGAQAAASDQSAVPHEDDTLSSLDAALQAQAEQAEREAREQAEREAREQAERQAQEEAAAALREQEAQAARMRAQAPMPPTKKSSKLPVLIGLILVALLACGAGAWYFLTQKDHGKSPAPAPVAQKDASKKAGPKTAEERVRDFFAGERDPQKAMDLAAELDPASSDDKDAVFRLYYYAAENGSPEGALRYAETVDPSLPGWGTVKKDAVEAWRYYARTPKGESARARLREWTENQAKAGNTAAREWLPNME